jgi:flavin-dependent dehydrogenase
MESEYYQIAIVGAGPAGCSAALWTARLCPQLAERILVLEKDRHPRMKVCAGGLTVEAMDALARMGLSLSIPHAKINHIRLLLGNHCLEIERPDCMGIVRRDRFDTMLCDAVKSAGIEVREEEQVTELGFSRGAWTLRTPKGLYRAKVVVGADGSRGLTHRLLPGFARYRGVGLTVDTPAIPGDMCDIEDGRITVDFTCNAAGIPGYMWHFPFCDGTRRGFNRGIYCCSLNAVEKRRNLVAVLKEGLRARGMEVQGRVLGGYGSGYYAQRPISGRNLLLAGDAAGGNIFTGEGISQALQYGQLVATEIARAFSRNEFSFRAYTARVAASDLGRELRDAARLARVFYMDGPAIAFPAMEADRALTALVAEYLCGARAFRTMQRDILTRMLVTSLKCGVPSFGTLCRLLARVALRFAGTREISAGS